ncbi:hypothetical protein K458DRAFT_482650 [Lentithecium fluviatile CBS 122367]|uniref:Uncharacterized protein n=1 Tax=Lentithecium fluviatile CBS 122367 TaxID=1168545 RepID=A0A6G1JPD4_9PLEO|nr:hypothetical protein K458DRAFT_482650 [Lentithecium fluviatile CBS 122367]
MRQRKAGGGGNAGRKPAATRLITSLSTFGITDAEEFDFGALDQYTPKDPNPPPLRANTIWFSGTEEDGGFEVGLSPDIKAKVQGVLEGCDKLDDKCYQEARRVIRSADFEVDHRLERRHFGHMLSKTIKGGWAIFVSFAATLYMSWYQKSKDLAGAESFMFIPVSKASEAAKFATATNVIISGGGNAVATITPTPEPTKLKGTHAPTVTSVTAAHDGLSPGDLAVSLDADLASRVEEIMRRSIDCEDGIAFDREHPSRKRGKSRLGKALCAYHAVLVNMGSSLSDLMETDFGTLNFGISTASPDEFAAYEEAMEFMDDNAVLLNIPATLAKKLGAWMFALSIGVIVDDKPLASMNQIPATRVQMATKPSKCPDPEEMLIMCAWGEGLDDCELEPFEGKKSEPRCVDDGTELSHCPCHTPPDIINSYITPQEQQSLRILDQAFKKFKVPEAKIECRNHFFSAPKKDADAYGAFSVERAIDIWCKDNAGKELNGEPGKENVFWTWGVTSLGVPDRSSFWLRATLNKAGSAKLDERYCKKALHKGLEECDKDRIGTHGHTASIGDIDYHVDLSGVKARLESPPWDEKPAFPPPEFLPGKDTGGAGNQPECWPRDGLQVFDPEFDALINAYCQDGKEIPGFGRWAENMFSYPPKGQPQWWEREGGYNSHLVMGAETINNGAKIPYDNMEWCEGYDWKMGHDDCAYALRKIRATCGRGPAFGSGKFIYRCVRYMLYVVNLRDRPLGSEPGDPVPPEIASALSIE